MKFSVYLLLIISLPLVSFILPVKKRVKIYLIGDSTMANKRPEVYPETGWGMMFGRYFNNRVEIDNRARNGLSTKSFISGNRWQPIADSLKKGDYVFIEFGHNDARKDKPLVGTTLEEYRTNLIKFITETRMKKAVPVLLTPVMRRKFKDSILNDTHGQYPDVVRDVAKFYDVPLIDMYLKSKELLKLYGEERSKELFNWVDSGKFEFYPIGIKDNTHFNPEGARKMAELAVEGIRELNLPISNHLK